MKYMLYSLVVEIMLSVSLDSKLILDSPSCMTQHKSLDLPVPQSPHPEVRIIPELIPQGCYKD